MQWGKAWRMSQKCSGGRRGHVRVGAKVDIEHESVGTFRQNVTQIQWGRRGECYTITVGEGVGHAPSTITFLPEERAGRGDCERVWYVVHDATTIQ